MDQSWPHNALNIDTVRRETKKWAEEHPAIESIKIFKGNGTFKYVMYIFYKGHQALQEIEDSQYDGFKKWLFESSDDDLYGLLVKAYAHIQEGSPLPHEWILIPWPTGIDIDLDDDLLTPEYCLEVYSNSPTDNDIDDTIKRAYPQVLRLYKAVLNKVDLNDPGSIDVDAAVDHAKDEIRANQAFYSLVPEAILRPSAFDPGGERQGSRVQWKLLQCIIEQRHGITMGWNSIKKQYRIITKAK